MYHSFPIDFPVIADMAYQHSVESRDAEL